MRGFVVLLAFLPGLAHANAQDRPAPGAGVAPYVSVNAPVFALTHVKLADGTGAPARSDQTIVVRGTRIESVGPAATARVPDGAQVIDLTGHTVFPGLVQLHEHTYFGGVRRMTPMTVSGPLLYLAFGVTTAMTAGSQFPYHDLNLKRAIEAGVVPGPRLHVTGPYLNGGPPRNTSGRLLSSPEEARRVIAYWAGEGATWFKLLGDVRRDVLGAAIAEAHSRGLKVTGHLCSVTFTEAAALGIDALQHGLITNSDYVPGKVPDVCPRENMRIQADVDVNSPAVQTSIRSIVANRAAVVSTLGVYETFMPERARLDPAALEMLDPEVRREVEANHAGLAQGGLVVPPRLLTKMMAWERAFVAAGGLLGAGSDPWGTGFLPGFGNLRNYELLVEAGFPPEQAVQIITLNGARILGEDRRTGSIAPGKRADLVVIRGDPLRSPADIYHVVTVFKDGLGYDSARLREAAKDASACHDWTGGNCWSAPNELGEFSGGQRNHMNTIDIAAPLDPGRKPLDQELDVFGLTHPGKVRTSNQDHFLICSLRKRMKIHQTSLPDIRDLALEPQRIAFMAMVADGVGGTAQGGEASRLAVEAVTRYVGHSMNCFYSADAHDDQSFSHSLEEAALKCHADIALQTENDPEHRSMATTLTLMLGVWPRVYLLQIGDTRYYILRAGELTQISHDQTVAQQLVDQGALTEAVASRSPWAHVLSSAIGGPQTTPVVTAINNSWDCLHLLCSDGLTKHVSEDQIRQRLSTMTSSKQVCEVLLNDALDGGGTDNITVIVCRAVPQ